MTPELSLKRHPYRLLRNGIVVACFSNFALASNSGVDRRQEETREGRHGSGRYTVRYGTDEYEAKRVQSSRRSTEELADDVT